MLRINKAKNFKGKAYVAADELDNLVRSFTFAGGTISSVNATDTWKITFTPADGGATSSVDLTQIKDYNAIHNTVVHLNSFVDGYRKYSALQKPLPKMVNLGEIVGDVSQLFSEVTWKNNLTSDIIIKTDPNLLRQILINLIKNAIEAGARTIGVDCERGNEGKVLLSVSNDGALIPAEARSSIFIPFFTTKRKGNGIGLSLSRRLLTLQGGMMSLLDHPRAGFHTTFLLEFPV